MLLLILCEMDLPWTALKRRCMKTKLHVTWRHWHLQLTILVYQPNCNVWNGLSLRFCQRSRNRLVELNSRCRFVDWLLERWQSVNDCNEQKECDLKGI